MALRGGLQNFGIADVFSLIGSQQKTGVLKVVRPDEGVSLHFNGGSVVRCTTTRREQHDLLGNIMVRAEAIDAEQLTKVLEKQKITGKRVGELLLESGWVTADEMDTFTRLQSTETVYRIFLWHSGNYEFTQADAAAADHTPVKAENLLMEGFRQADEWPNIRQRLTSYAMTFDKKEDLDLIMAAAGAAEPAADVDFDFSLDDSAAGNNRDPRLRKIEDRERRIFRLITPERDVQKLIDMSRLGEFETCKALANLIEAGFIAARPLKPSKASSDATVGGIGAEHRGSRGSTAQVVWAAAGGFLWLVVVMSGLSPFAANRPWERAAFVDTRLETILSSSAQDNVEHALAVYHASHGSYPSSLDVLVQDSLLRPMDLQFPWKTSYVYSRNDGGYTLLRPIY